MRWNTLRMGGLLGIMMVTLALPAFADGRGRRDRGPRTVAPPHVRAEVGCCDRHAQTRYERNCLRGCTPRAHKRACRVRYRLRPYCLSVRVGGDYFGFYPRAGIYATGSTWLLYSNWGPPRFILFDPYCDLRFRSLAAYRQHARYLHAPAAYVAERRGPGRLDDHARWEPDNRDRRDGRRLDD